MAKEAYTYGKRDLFTWQKRPMHMAKEAYHFGIITRVEGVKNADV
jgi:hypothetical protein